MTTEDKIKAVRTACQKSNPDTAANKTTGLVNIMVMLRDKNHGGYAIDQDGLFVRPKANHPFGWDPIERFSTPPCWDIYHDSLSEQSDQTIDFIYRYLEK